MRLATVVKFPLPAYLLVWKKLLCVWCFSVERYFPFGCCVKILFRSFSFTSSSYPSTTVQGGPLYRIIGLQMVAVSQLLGIEVKLLASADAIIQLNLQKFTRASCCMTLYYISFFRQFKCGESVQLNVIK